jgi:FKBP-type peptidyl-prolyl cis-trans isomerase
MVFPSRGRVGPFWVPIFLALAGVACSSSTAPVPKDPTELTFDSSLGVDLDQMTRTPSGLYYQVLEEGEGEETAVVGDLVGVYYTVWLHDGTQLDSREEGNALVSRLGDFIAGFDEGVEGMRIGELKLLVIPWELGYGDTRVGDIPPYSTLVFRIRLVSITKF